MIRHSNSFFISIVLHSIIFVLLFTLYKFISTEIHKEAKPKKETKVCLHLQCLKEETPIKPALIPLKKEIIEKKTLINKAKKIKKKVLKKKLKVKKTIKKKVPLKTKKKKKKEKKIAHQTQIQKKIITPKATQTKSEKIVVPKKLTNHILQKKKPSVQKKYINENISKIRDLIKENLYYPRRAKKRGIEGVVVIRFKLSTKAVVSGIEIVSSKKEILSRAAIKTIESLSSKFPKPIETITLKVPISYKLKR